MGRRAAVPLLFVLFLAGCASERSDGPRSAAEGLYAAVAAGDGDKACSHLGENTVTQLEKDEGKPCPEAVLSLELTGRRARATAVYVTEAKVDLARGDSVFLEETPEGWRVTAAGCKPEPGEETPYDCEVES